MAWLIGIAIGAFIGQVFGDRYAEYCDSKGWGDFKSLAIGAALLLGTFVLVIVVLLLTGVATITVRPAS